jgi:hypothetical protein
VFQTNFKVDASGFRFLMRKAAPFRCSPPARRACSAGSRARRGIQHDDALAYVQDRWVANPHMTFNLGMRYEHATSRPAPRRERGRDRIVPRLGTSYDLNADGKTVILGTTPSIGASKRHAVSKNTIVGNSTAIRRCIPVPAAKDGFSAAFDPANYAGRWWRTFPR